MNTSSPYLAKSHNLRIASPDDAMTVIASGIDRCIFTLDDLSPDFFDLRNRLAGEVFQKFTLYGIRAAFVIPENHGLGERVSELAREHARHAAIRIMPTVEDAHLWLAKF